MKKIGFITLGCDKNRVDGEKILGNFIDNGYETVADPMLADVIIVNTCGFIESAKEESLDAIFDMCAIKEQTGAKLIVTGCLSQRYGDELKKEIPEVDVFLPLNKNEDILSVCESEYCKANGNRVLTTPPHYAYIKIADGCNNRCAFCAIPSIRGNYISTPIEDIVCEAEKVIRENGVRELILVAQDTTRYGKDLYGKYTLIDLLDKLSSLEVEWIRLLYCYPELVSDELLDYIDNNPKVCKYLDIPFQHCSDNMLRAMRRRNTKEQAIDLIKRIRAKKSYFAIRSTFMVGFPGESEQDFEELIDFIKTQQLDNVGFFAYSREEGTASYDMKGQVSEKVKKARLKSVFLAQQESVFKSSERFVGQTIKVLYEGIDEDKQAFYGRCEYQAPDIDGKVYFTSDICPMVGEFYKVKITKVVGYDLEGELVNEYSK